MFGGAMMMCMVGLFVLILINMFFQIAILTTIILWFGAFLMGLYIIYDTQLILGRGSVSLTVDDYIFAAMNLYIDVVQLFIYIL